MIEAVARPAASHFMTDPILRTRLQHAAEESFRHGTALAPAAYGNRALGTRRPTIRMPATLSRASDFTEVSGLPESTSVPICAAVDHDFVDRLASAFLSSPVAGIVSAYVFGSRLAGRAHRESDLDLGVLFDRTHYPTRALRFDARVTLAAYLARTLETRDVDLVGLDD